MCQIIGVFERPFFVPLFVGQTWDICPLFVHFLSHICPTTKTTLFFAILGDPSTTEYLLDRPPTSARPGGSLAPIQPVARRCRASHPHARPTTVRAGAGREGGGPALTHARLLCRPDYRLPGGAAGAAGLAPARRARRGAAPPGAWSRRAPGGAAVPCSNFQPQPTTPTTRVARPRSARGLSVR